MQLNEMRGAKNRRQQGNKEMQRSRENRVARRFKEG